ncbi:uncharacterized protein [Magallana gigas]|uniref:uncharacterized protein isoform X2 n=1 Tax=Magallana gigas TaxID=29159 RepID=UPI00333EFC3F
MDWSIICSLGLGSPKNDTSMLDALRNSTAPERAALPASPRVLLVFEVPGNHFGRQWFIFGEMHFKKCSIVAGPIHITVDWFEPPFIQRIDAFPGGHKYISWTKLCGRIICKWPTKATDL